jgi:hypothetical protein
MTVQANQGFGVTVFTTGAGSGGGGSTTPGGGTGTIQYNNAGAFAGAAGVTTDGTTLTVSGSSASDMLHITQTGAGNALVVEDSANPDSSPFVIDTNGKVIVGATVAPPTIETIAPLASLSSAAASTAAQDFGIYNYQNAGGSARVRVGSKVFFARSRSATVGSLGGLVTNGDMLGQARFVGDDGSALLAGAEITAEVDGVAASGSMPGRLTFSTTASGASTPTERMRIDATGQVGIGTNPAAGRTLAVGKTITGSTTSRAIAATGAIQADVTTTGSYFATSASTAASTTLANLHHYSSLQGSFGAGTFVSIQAAFYAEAAMIGAANNYGVYGLIPAGVSRTITTVDRTSNVVTITTSAAHGYLAGQSVTVAAVTNTGVNGTFTITAVPTTATFTYAQVGADIPSGADTGTTVIVGRYNAYMAGTAPNYFNGSVGIGTLTGLNKLDINGSLGRGAPVTKTGNFTLAATENWIIVNNASADTTVTLPAASLWTGRELMLKNLSATYTVISASSNVVPIDGTTAGTAILAAGAGNNCTIVSDGTNWVVMRA